MRKVKLSKPKKDGLLEYISSLGGEVESRIGEGWSNSNTEQLMWWMGAGAYRLKSKDATNRGRYTTEPWWCLPERRAECAKQGLCLKGNCVGTRKEKFKACRKVRLFQIWGFTT